MASIDKVEPVGNVLVTKLACNSLLFLLPDKGLQSKTYLSKECYLKVLGFSINEIGVSDFEQRTFITFVPSYSVKKIMPPDY